MATGFQMHVSIPYFSAVPEDVVTNVWSATYVTLNPSPSDWAAWRSRLVTFYNAVYGAAGLQMAPWMRPALTTFKGYDLLDPIPRAPKFTSVTALTVTTPATPSTTPETAVCLSFQGALSSGLPQSRRRGRIFLGGLGSPLAPGAASVFPNVDAGRRVVITGAATALMAGMTADGWTWSVYSRMNDNLIPVANGWVDDAPDTQRRRGNAPTIRSVF